MSRTVSEAESSDQTMSTEIDESGLESEELEESDASEKATDSEGSSTESLPLDQVFGILKNQRRRYVLQYLYDSDEQVTLSDVAEQIAAWENDKDVRQISSSERKRVYVGLYQCHLPKMDGVDVVSFNKPRGIIELGENADAVYDYLEVEEENAEPPWHIYSVALALSGAIVLGAALAVQSMTALPVVSLAVTVSILAFSAYGLVNIVWIRSNGEQDDDTDEV